jgi:hypothetical protein
VAQASKLARAARGDHDAIRAFGPVVALQLCIDAGIAPTQENTMKAQLKTTREHLEGRVLVPALLWMAGAPFGVVLLLWLFFFRGH